MFPRRRFLSLLPLAAFALLTACGNQERKPAAAPKSIEDRFTLRLGDRAVQAQVALLPAETQQGLMYRQTMGAEEGMIFLFERPQQMSFWMRNTPTPLDIGFFTPDGVLGEVHAMYPFDETPVRSAGADYTLALEVNQGWFAKQGLKPGAKVNLLQMAEALRARGFRPERYSIRTE